MTLTPAALRAHATARTLPPRTTLQAALDRLGFVQADPIRAPARAQDLILMQRVKGYRAGDLERHYPRLNVEEDIIPNYGFVTRDVQRLLHPRGHRPLRIDQHAPGLTERVLAHVLERGEVHPRDVEAALGRQSVGNYWGGQSSATTSALDALHYRGHLRVTRREGGVRLYAPATHLDALRAAPLSDEVRALGLVHLITNVYAPLPRASLTGLLSLCGYGAPGLTSQLRAALNTALGGTLTEGRVDGVPYIWPAAEAPGDAAPMRGARIVAPFDPLVWDRRRFEHLHGWAYRFEAYTPAAKRTLGYYALPVLHADRAVGWANLSVNAGTLHADVQYRPDVRQTATLTRAVNAELDRYRAFLGAR
ncbi:DNA glycosylase AlkZ-like family protein [Deinococcus maricopensis]|uniref:Winged helix-turn-helix domain-containing protein n=1 Tax=Deinococcus maricopensis (strain DSM 21211 / LMG 22137 / NRRL B-23946 / LB-34) TaxID=709986 RepID=E8U688_DEIML|nr:crosslink repair DNA glycosylase YcaQ family protein [Deinococcus maricopensis]ADV66577.1 protein of unknown function DUF1006 [Deinococcus maricopensis DSM 21211]